MDDEHLASDAGDSLQCPICRAALKSYELADHGRACELLEMADQLNITE